MNPRADRSRFRGDPFRGVIWRALSGPGIWGRFQGLPLFLLLLLLFPSCYLPTDPGPPPNELIDTEFEPGYNVFGVLRNDGTPGSSFIRVEQTFQLTEVTDEFIPTITNLTIRVRRPASSTIHEFQMREDSLRGLIYASPEFDPVPGASYLLTITGGDLPDVTAEVTVPQAPSLLQDSVSISEHSISFSLRESSEISLYEIYLICTREDVTMRKHAETSGVTEVTISTTASAGEPIRLEIYGYESNMTEYITAPVTIKPQTYRETVTTVTGGYGLFGAVSLLRCAL